VTKSVNKLRVTRSSTTVIIPLCAPDRANTPLINHVVPSTSKYILGISAYYHDSAAALLRDGEIVAAASEERFTRKKGDASVPIETATYCLREAGITVVDLAGVGFYDKPMLKFDRILETYLAVAPAGFGSFLKAGPLWVKEKLFSDRELRTSLGHLADPKSDDPAPYEGDLFYAEHHESHAASAFYPSPFKDAAILTMDRVGEWATASICVGRGSELEVIKCSIGPIRSASCTRRLRTIPGSMSTR
jgi:carbamoyltransferase